MEPGIGIDPSVEHRRGGLLGVEESQIGADDIKVEGKGIRQSHLAIDDQLSAICTQGKAAEEQLPIDDRQPLVLHAVALVERRDIHLTLMECDLAPVGERPYRTDVAGGEIIGDLTRELSVSLCILIGEEGIEHLERQVIYPEVKPLVVASLGHEGKEVHHPLPLAQVSLRPDHLSPLIRLRRSAECQVSHLLILIYKVSQRGPGCDAGLPPIRRDVSHVR